MNDFRIQNFDDYYTAITKLKDDQQILLGSWDYDQEDYSCVLIFTKALRRALSCHKFYSAHGANPSKLYFGTNFCFPVNLEVLTPERILELKKAKEEKKKLRIIMAEIEELEEAGIEPFYCLSEIHDYKILVITPDQIIALADKIIEFRNKKKG